MKKLTAILLAAILVFALCACGGNADPAAQTDNVDTVNNTSDAGTPVTTPGNDTEITTWILIWRPLATTIWSPRR